MHTSIRNICFAVLLAALSACSDSGTEAAPESRALNSDQPFVVVEGDEGKRTTIPIAFTSSVTGTFTYSTFNITAAEKSDFMPVSGTINLIEGNDYLIEITIVGDDEIEGDELIGLSLKQDGELIDEYFGLIINDDLPRLNITTTAVLEGDSGTSLLEFVFELQENTVDPYTFSITTPVVDVANNNPDEGIFYAVPGIDFQAINQPITFTKDLSSISIEVLVNSDNVIELDELVAIQAGYFNNAEREALLSALGRVIGEQELGEITANGIIRTDDSIDTNGFDLKSVSGSAKEGNSDDINNLSWTQVTYTITVENPDNIIDDQVVQIKLEGLDVNIGELGWAMPGLDQDYCANNPSVPLENGQIECSTLSSYPLTAGTKTFDISFYVRADLDVEGENEDIKINIQNDQGVTFGEFFHSIEEDDFPSIMVTYNSGNGEPDVIENFENLIEAGITINEGETLTLGLNLEYPQSVEYLLIYEIENDQSTSINSSDYSVADGQAKSDEVAISSGATQGVGLDIGINDDTVYEGRERFTLEVDGIGKITVSIIDNDLPVLVLKSPTEPEIARDTANFGAVKLDEQDLQESNNTDESKLYDFDLVLDNSASALSGLKVSYNINNAFFLKASTMDHLETLSAIDCSYLSGSNLKRKAIHAINATDDNYDYRIFIGNEEVAPGGKVDLEQGQSSLSLQIEVNNDLDVECLEFLSLNFVLEPSEEGLDVSNVLPEQFEISNKDKAILQVSGWSLDEGSSTDSAATTDTAFTLSLDQPILSDINFTLASTDANNCGDDIANVQAATHRFSGESNELSKTVAVNISQDNVVEPDEICKLSITSVSVHASDVIEVKYSDGGDHAQGIIKNDDLLTITVNTNDTAEPEDGDDNKSIGTYSWDKEIAANVPAISFKVSQNACAPGINCVESADTNFSVGNSAVIQIHAGTEISTQLIPDTASPLSIEIIDDNEVENTEVLSLTFSRTLDEKYVNAFETPVRIVNISNTDKLALSIDELLTLADIKSNGEEGSRTYAVSWGDKTVSDTVGKISLNLSTASVATRKTDASQSLTEHEYLIKVGANEIYSNSFTLKNESEALLENESVQFHLILNDDDLVEKIEIIDISLSSIETDYVLALTGSDIDSGKVTHSIGIDDKLQVSLTPATGYTGNSSEEDTPNSHEYTISWAGEVASNVPELLLDLSQADTSTATIVADYTVIKTDAKFNGTTFQLKAASASLTSGTDAYTLAIENDSLVEIDETIETRLQYGSDLFSYRYITLIDTADGNTTDNKINLIHTINDSDTAEISLRHISGDTTSFENAAVLNTYALSWDTALPVGVASQTVTLPFIGTATRGDINDDYTVTSSDTAQLTIDAETNTFTIIKATDAILAAGSVEFTVKINNDSVVEDEENIAATISAVSNKFAINNSAKSLAQVIKDTDKTNLTLKRVSASASDTSSENDENKIFYALAWAGDLPAGAPSLTVSLPFLGTATRDSDYTVSVAAVSAEKLTISGDTFTIEKTVGEILEKGLVEFEVSVINDTNVEITETISVTIADFADGSDSANYLTLSSTEKSLGHSITDTDTTQLTLTRANGSSNSDENNESTQLYTLAWDQILDKGVGSLTVDLPFTGTATKDSDYTVSVAAASADELTINGNTLTIIKDTAVVLPANGTVQFEVSIINDTDVEITETISAIMESPSGRATLDSSSKSLAHNINDTDTATITLAKVSGSTSVAEEDASTANITYNLTWDQNLGMGIGSQTIDLPFTGTAIKDTDYNVIVPTASAGKLTISGNTLTIIKDTAVVLAANGTVQFEVSIINDTDVEITESINATLASSSGSRIIAAANNSLTHNITDTDTAKLTLTASAIEGSEDSGSITYTLTWDAKLGKGITAPTVNLGFTGTANDIAVSITGDIGAATSSDESQLTISGSTLTIVKDTDAELDASNAEFTVSVTDDAIVEYNETIIATLSSPTPTGKAVLDDDTSLSYTITNDDKITVTIVNAVTTEGNALELNIAGYEADSSIADNDLTLTFDYSNADATATESADYEATPTATQILTTGIVASDQPILLVIKEDDHIEPTETLKLAITDTAKNLFALPENSSWSITSPEQFSITTASKQVEDDAQNYLTTICAKGLNGLGQNVDYTVQKQASETISLDISQAADELLNNADYLISYKNAVAGTDFELINGVVLPLDGFTAAGSCQDVAILSITANNTADDNKHLKYKVKAVSDTDTRIDTSAFVTIINNDFNMVTDTGLTKCMHDNTGITRHKIIGCDDAGIDTDRFTKQDAVATDAVGNINREIESGIGDSNKRYATLSYTEVDTNGNPMAEANESDYSYGICFQDNSTGLLWTKTPAAAETKPSNTSANGYCGRVTTGDWQLPTLQQLMSVANHENMKLTGTSSGSVPVKTLRNSEAIYIVDPEQEVDIDPSASTDLRRYDSYYNSAHWTSSPCTNDDYIDAALGNGFWTLDLFSGVTRCEPSTNTNYVIYVSD